MSIHCTNLWWVSAVAVWADLCEIAVVILDSGGRSAGFSAVEFVCLEPLVVECANVATCGVSLVSGSDPLVTYSAVSVIFGATYLSLGDAMHTVDYFERVLSCADSEVESGAGAHSENWAKSSGSVESWYC